MMNCSHWLLTSEILNNVTNSLRLSMQKGFNLNMRMTNFLVTAGLGPLTEWIHGDLGRFKCPERHCRSNEVSVKERLVGGTMTFPKQRWCKGSKSGFLCECVWVCLFFWSRSSQGGEQHRKSMVCPSLGASQTLSTDTTVFCGESLSWIKGGLPQLWISESPTNRHYRSIESNLSKVYWHNKSFCIQHNFRTPIRIILIRMMHMNLCCWLVLFLLNICSMQILAK